MTIFETTSHAPSFPTTSSPILTRATINKGLKVSLYSVAIAGIGVPVSMATWVALALIGY
jgi:hypothetical protein